MASEWENQVARYFHAMRSAAKDRRRPHPVQERLNQAMIERAGSEQRRRVCLDVLEIEAERFMFERLWD